MIEFIRTNWIEILTLMREHLVLVLVSTAIAVAIGLPTGVALTRYERLRAPVLVCANIFQTVPSLALFGLLIPLPLIGGIGARTAIVAMVLYALLPIIRNTVTGILGVDRNVREAAVAMGMTNWQILRQVELPLALSVILTGVRVAIVISVGVATIAASIGAGGLGTYIFRGVRGYDNHLILAGAVPAALMALAADFILGRFEKLVDPERRRSRWFESKRAAVIGICIALVIAGVQIARHFRSTSAPGAVTLTVGSKDFTESILLAEIFAQMMEQRGVVVQRNFELGGNLAHDAIVAGKLDVYPEYTGTSYTAILGHTPVTDTKVVYDHVQQEYLQRFQLSVGPPLGFSNDFAILIRGADAQRLGLSKISEAARFTPAWTAGFGQDFKNRADGFPGFSKAYGLSFAQVREMDLSLTYHALADKQVDLIAGNSTDGLIATLHLVQLADDRHYFPPYQAVFIVREDSAKRVPGVSEVLSALADSISTDDMRRLNYEVDGNKRAPKDVVREWLARRPNAR